MTQLRMFAEEAMPRGLIAPLESDLVDRIRASLKKLGYLTFSGRVAIFDANEEARAARVARGWPLFIPVFGPGTPDILVVGADRTGRLFGLEAKRDLTEKERKSQRDWREMASYFGVLCQTVHSVEEAIEFLEENRSRLGG